MNHQKRTIEEIADEFNDKLAKVIAPQMDAVDLLDLMDYYEHQGMEFEAELCRRIATRNDPDNPEVLITNAHWDADGGDWNSVKRLNHSNAVMDYDLHLFEVEQLVKRGLLFDALQFIASKLPPNYQTEDYDFMFDSALLFRDYGYPRQSMYLARHIPKEYVDYSNVADLIVDNDVAMARYGEARKLLDKMIDKSPFNKQLWTRLAYVNYQSGNFSDSSEAVEYALAIGRDEEATRVKNYTFLHQTGRAQEFVEGAISAQDYAALVEAADCYYRAGHAEEALHTYMLAALYCPRGNRDREYIVGRIVICRIQVGETDDAIDHLRSIHLLGGNIWSAGFETMQVAFEYGKEDTAIGVLQTLLDLQRIQGNRWNYVADLLCHYNCYDAVENFWKFLFKNPQLLSPSYQMCIAKAKLHWGITSDDIPDDLN